MALIIVNSKEENFQNRFDPEVRKLFIGGTDIAAILKMHPYRKKYRVWLEKNWENGSGKS